MASNIVTDFRESVYFTSPLHNDVSVPLINKMSGQTGIVEPVTPAPSDLARSRRAEDSGYCSFTPGSIECSEVSIENLDPNNTQHSNDVISENRRERRCRRYKGVTSVARNEQQSPSKRRALKRPYQEEFNTSDASFNSIPTPTSVISKRIQRLGVGDDFDASITQSSLITECSGSVSMETFSCTTSNPTTPVKSCPLRTIDSLHCSVRRSPKKLNFAYHSLPGEIYVSQEKPPTTTAKATFRPDQKVDIIKMLYYGVRTMPALKKIFEYLSDEDVYNYSKVNSTCLQICKQVPEARVKEDNHSIYKTITKENNASRGTIKLSEILSQGDEKDLGPSLKDIHNIVNGHLARPSTQRSPPTTPKTRRFKVYTKSASLDSRVQLSCVRCQQPAKVTEEITGEEWVECTSVTCCYQFCRFCQCERHPNKICLRYDLEGPSPSKRKKKISVIGTKKSKKSLQRLLF